MLHEFPSKEIRCPDEQRAIRHLNLKSPRCPLDHDSWFLLQHWPNNTTLNPLFSGHWGDDRDQKGKNRLPAQTVHSRWIAESNRCPMTSLGINRVMAENNVQRFSRVVDRMLIKRLIKSVPGIQMTVCIDGVKTNRSCFKRITVIRHTPETVEPTLINLSLNISFDIMFPQTGKKGTSSSW